MALRRLVAVAAIAGALLLSSCASPAVSGRWGSADNDNAYIDIRAGGQFSGFDGCNAFSGEWKIENSTAVFGETTQTLMGCIGAPDQWLSLAGSAEVTNGELVIFDRRGNLIGSLPRP